MTADDPTYDEVIAAAALPGLADDVRVVKHAIQSDARSLGIDFTGRVGRILAALEAATTRADQAEQRIADAPHGKLCGYWRHACTCWKSAAPTAEQVADPNRCPSCRHAEHDGFQCLNMASDNDCACTYGLRLGAD